MQTIFTIVTSIFWIAYGLFVVVSLATSASNSKALTLPYKSFIVQSGSMEPTIMTGDVIFIEPKDTYGTNEIVTFTDAAGRTVTHRVLSEEAGLLTTKGDNNQATDPELITQKNIIGEYRLRIPYAGYALVYSQKPFGMFLMIALPLIAIVGSEVFKEKPKNHEVKNP